jgi:histidinol phosphatase-like enzyme
MFFEAQEILNVDLANSIMIGDSLSDMEAATNAGVPNRFLLDHLVHRSSNYVVVENLIACAEKIKVLAENRNKQIKDGRK